MDQHAFHSMAAAFALLAQGCTNSQLPSGEASPARDPTAWIRASPETGAVPLEVTLIGQLSPSDTEATYAWSFGDGTHAQGSRIRHTYETADYFEVRLTITDARGRISSARTRIDARPIDSPWQLFAQPAPRIVMRGLGIDSTLAPHAAASAESETLDVAVEVLQASHAGRIRIQAATDDVGSAAENQALSTRQADAVLVQLVARGISPDRLEASGIGESHPLTSNATADGRAQNRRVEIQMLESELVRSGPLVRGEVRRKSS